MKDLIEIEHKNSALITQEVVDSYFNLFSTLVSQWKEIEIWPNSIEKLILTDRFEERVVEEAAKWNVQAIVSTKKHFVVTSKIIFNRNLNEPKHILLFSLLDVMSPTYPLLEMSYSQILRIKSNNIIPKKIQEESLNNKYVTLDDYLLFSSIEWVKAYYTKSIISTLDIKNRIKLEQKNILSSFKSDLKKYLFEYNKDHDSNGIRLDDFWNKYHNSKHKLILHLIESNQIPINFDDIRNDESLPQIKNLIAAIELLTENCKKGLGFNLSNLKVKYKELSAFYEVHLEKEKSDCFYIRLPKNPKDYFNNSLIETEPRLVCFMDILGFSEKIREYDNNETSTLLQDIQEAFRLAKEQFIDAAQNQDVIKHLKYQTFSDNICISIPYFDNEEDFLASLNLISVYVRGLSLIMMSKKLFMRGGISMGSFYSDDNIIFSSALVKSYNLESKVAIYPRVVIDDEIIGKLMNYRLANLQKFNFGTSILFDWENTGFLFPFDLIQDSKTMLTNAFNDIIQDDKKGDVYNGLINKLLDSVKNLTENLLNKAADEEDKGKEEIRNTILEQIIDNQSNKRAMNKFIWLLELLNWSQNEPTRLKFEYLKDRFQDEKPTDNK